MRKSKTQEAIAAMLPKFRQIEDAAAELSKQAMTISNELDGLANEIRDAQPDFNKASKEEVRDAIQCRVYARAFNSIGQYNRATARAAEVMCLLHDKFSWNTEEGHIDVDDKDVSPEELALIIPEVAQRNSATSILEDIIRTLTGQCNCSDCRKARGEE